MNLSVVRTLYVFLICSAFVTLINSCKKQEVDPAIRIRSTEGAEWSQATWTGGGDAYSPRNYFYTFDVIANLPASLTVTSADINVGMYVYDENGAPVGYRSGFGHNESVSFTPKNSGTYKVLVCSQNRNAEGEFTVRGQGLNSGFSLIPYNKIELLNQDFSQDGGGGEDLSPKNQLYTFEVTNINQPLDIDVISPNKSAWIRLFNPNGDPITIYGSGNHPYFVFDSRTENVIKGTYKLWVGTTVRDATAKTFVQIVGNVKNLQRTTFQRATISGSYQPNKIDYYQFKVTANDSPIDLAIITPNGSSTTSIYPPNSNNRVGAIFTFYPYDPYEVLKLDEGIYRVAVESGYGVSNGNYTLTLHGNITDFKKQ